jgi:hypothetical protein
VAKGAKWVTKLVEGLCPRHPLTPPPTIRLLEPEELPGGVRPILNGQCAVMHKLLQLHWALQPPPGLVWDGAGCTSPVCTQKTLLCAKFCAPETVTLGLLYIARHQRMLVPASALLCMLLAIACLGHMQQRPRSDLPQLRERWYSGLL